MHVPEQNKEPNRIEILHSQLDIESIFATQALAMGFLRHRARTRRRNDNRKAYGFAFLNTNASNDIDNLYDGSEEEYLTCRVEKMDFDQWRMSVRFRQNIFTEEKKAKTTVEDYRFDWLKNGNNQAWASTTEIGAHGDNGHVQAMIDRHPVSTDENNELRLRMHDVAHSVNPIEKGSIYANL